MATWTYRISVEGGGEQIVEVSGTQYQTVTSVQAYATGQGHTIIGGTSLPGTSLVKVLDDDPLDLLSVDSVGNLVVSGQANALSGNAANSVLTLSQSTGSTLYPGKGMKIGVNSSSQLEAQDLTGDDRPTIWANGSHINNGDGEYVFRGRIDNILELFKSSSSHYLTPLTSGTAVVYWDIENKRFTTENDGWPKCGEFHYSSMSYVLDAITDFDWSSNISIDSDSEVNEIRNKTVLSVTSGGTFRHFTINDPNGTNSWDDIWETGDRFAIVYIGGSNSQGTISVVGAAELLDPGGNRYTNDTIIISANTNDQSFLLEVIDDNGTQKWQVIKEDKDIVETDVIVDFHMMQESLGRMPFLKEESDDTWQGIILGNDGRLGVKDLSGTKKYFAFTTDNSSGSGIENLNLQGFEMSCTSDHVVNIQPGKVPSDDDAYLIDMSSSGTINITLSGAGPGKMDTGSVGTNNWYAIWIFANSTDDSTELRISLSSSSPTVPSGYDKKALIGYCRTDGLQNFLRFGTYGTGPDKMFIWEDEVLTISNVTLSTTKTTVSATARVPPMPRGYTYIAMSVEMNTTSNAVRIHHLNDTETFTFIRGDSRYGSVPQVMLNSSGEFGISCNSGSVTGTYIKITAFLLRL